MDFELSDRVAIITGCSVGIGREVAKVLASEGVQTVVIARRGGLLATLQEEIVAAGGIDADGVFSSGAVGEDTIDCSEPGRRSDYGPTSALSRSSARMRVADCDGTGTRNGVVF